MMELKGKYGSAKVFTDVIDQESISQIINLLNQPFAKNSHLRMMPDVHAGAGCTIGTTMKITDKVVPNLVGVDIGCGMLCLELNNQEIDFAELDEAIRMFVPSGFSMRDSVHPYLKNVDLSELIVCQEINMSRAELSLGTLGGGNHFIEVDKDDAGKLFLVIHTGSRNLGKQVAETYQNLAFAQCNDRRSKIQKEIEQLKASGRQSEIEARIKQINNETPKVPKALAYCGGELMENYLHDMRIVQNYAKQNRRAIADVIVRQMNLSVDDMFETVHNYIDVDEGILRKGAISCKRNERVLIPINMRDGSLICNGKGNPEWNCSGPHGAGRLMSRSKAKSDLFMDEFEKEMSGIWSTSVLESTIDESPMAYKSMDDIVNNITDTASIERVIKPVYNFKAS